MRNEVFFTNFFICFYVIKSSYLHLFKDRGKHYNTLTFIDIKGSESLAVGQTTNHFNRKQEKLSNIYHTFHTFRMSIFKVIARIYSNFITVILTWCNDKPLIMIIFYNFYN